MSQIAPISLAVGSETVDFIPAGTQTGKEPSMYTTVGPDLSLDQQSTLSHLATSGPANRSVRARLVTKSIVTSDGLRVVSGVLSGEIKFTFPKTSLLSDRQKSVDLMIAYLTAERDHIASTEVMY